MPDPDKIPDAPRHSVTYCGMTLTSRYGKRSELEDMMQAVDSVAERGKRYVTSIESILCDSNCTYNYIVECKSGYEDTIADLLDHAFKEVHEGHNGILIRSDAAEVDVDPDWLFDHR